MSVPSPKKAGIPRWQVHEGDLPLLATAIHNGHFIPSPMEPFLAIGDADRLREEDPYTGEWTHMAPNRAIVRLSRFAVDMNRPRDKAIYLTPDESWGLRVWRETLPPDLAAARLEDYDAFYRRMFKLMKGMEQRFGRFVVLDLHSYNHRRNGPNAPPAAQEGNPDVNVGTGAMPDRSRWSLLGERFMTDLRNYPFPEGRLDVRENVKFRGAAFQSWIYQNFPESACVLSVEVKKIFMDEWTGAMDAIRMDEVQKALASTVPGLLEGLR